MAAAEATHNLLKLGCRSLSRASDQFGVDLLNPVEVVIAIVAVVSVAVGVVDVVIVGPN